MLSIRNGNLGRNLTVISMTNFLSQGAVVLYHEGQGKVFCCCRIAPRDGVFIAGLKMLTSDTAIFAMKTVDHPSYPPKEDGYRVNAPLIGLFVQQEGYEMLIQSFFTLVRLLREGQAVQCPSLYLYSIFDCYRRTLNSLQKA